MLVLSRKETETLVCRKADGSDRIVITVVRLKGNQVRLGVNAPAHIRVIRGEIEDVPEAGNAANTEGQDESNTPTSD